LSRFSRIADSYRARLILGYVLVAAVFAIAWGLSLYGPLTRAAINQQRGNLEAIAHEGALYAAEASGTPEQIAKLLAAGTSDRITIIATNGKVLADSQVNPATMENHATRPEVVAALKGRVGTDERISATEGTRQLYLAVPASLHGQPVVFRVSQEIAQVGSVADRARRLGVWLLLAALVMAALIATWASGAASRPIRELSAAAEKMAAGNLSVEIPDVPTDLAGLADALRTLKRQMRSRLSALESEQRTLRAALDGLSDAVFLFEAGAVRYANGSASRIFKAPPTGWRDTDLDRLGLPESLAEPIRAHLLAEQPFSAELEPDPLGRTLRLLIVPLDPGREGGRVLAVVSDITERARLDRIRRDFVANASHELKTPVAGIQLLAQSAESAASDGDVEQSLAFTHQIEAEADRLRRLVSDLLDLSRLETPPEADAVTDVRQAVDNAIIGHRAAASRKGLELGIDLSTIRGMDVFVAAEPTDVAVALDNLLDNAIAYTEKGEVTVGVRARPGAVTIAVSDTGPGIESEHLPRIFERFYRIDRARSRQSGGTGLGLALVRHVAERNGGSVSVESTVGVGSTFKIRLPRAT